MKRAALSAPSLVIAPASRIGLLAITPIGAALEARERGDHLGGEGLAQEAHRAGVGEPLDRGADVVGAAAALGDDVAQQRLVGLVPVGERALEVGDQALGGGHRLGLVGDRDVDDPVRRLDGERADRLGLEGPEAATLDHRRAAHAERGRLGGDDQVRAAGEHGVAGEAAAGDDRDPRHHARRAAPRARRRECRAPRRPRSRCRPGARRRPPRAAPWAGACARSARTGGPSCDGRSRPGSRRAPCSRRRAPRSAARSPCRSPLIRAVPAISPSAGVRAISSAVSRRCALRRDREAAVLDQAARVDQVGEVLARRAGTGCVAALDRLRARVVAGSADGARAPRRGRRERRPHARRKTRIRLSPVGLAVTNATLDGVAVGLRCEDGTITDSRARRSPRRRATSGSTRAAWRWSRASSTPTRTRR